MRKTKIEWHVPQDVMIEGCNATLKAFPGYCTDKWGEKEAAYCRDWCGQQFAHIETDWFRAAAITLRKAKKLAAINGGPQRKKVCAPSGEYAKYLESKHWVQFRLYVLEFWSYKCALCAGKAKDVHHNFYRRYAEQITDVVPLCSRCHKKFHSVMPDGNQEFSDHAYALSSRYER